MTEPGGDSFDVSALPAVPRLPGAFVTGTAPGVGKTTVAGAVARHFRHRGVRVEVFKPVATGCRTARGGPVSDEADYLAACAESARTLAEIAPVRLTAHARPAEAAAGGAPPVRPETILDAWRDLARRAEAVVVDATGELTTPLTDAFWCVHLAAVLSLPLVLVVRPSPGEVARALAALTTARAAGLTVAGIVVNRYRPDAAGEQVADACMTVQPGLIARLDRTAVLATVGEDAEQDVAAGRLGYVVRHAIDQADWARILRRR